MTPMKPEEVLARHNAMIGPSVGGGPRQEFCEDCDQPWPCDAVDQARHLVAERKALRVARDLARQPREPL